uniref:Uncharacterized protein n=1 Tax=Anopheles atroparvus TaxID=41427 RepID=A0AAG5D4L6_ANOAO
FVPFGRAVRCSSATGSSHCPVFLFPARFSSVFTSPVRTHSQLRACINTRTAGHAHARPRRDSRVERKGKGNRGKKENPVEAAEGQRNAARFPEFSFDVLSRSVQVRAVAFFKVFRVHCIS